MSVPSCFRINDDGRAVLALVEASGFVGADGAFQSKLSEPVFESFLQFAFSGGIATAARGVRIALIPADENMLFKFRHGDSLRDEARARQIGKRAKRADSAARPAEVLRFAKKRFARMTSA